MKKINYLLALWCLLINAVLANAQNCNPKIMGKQSLCGPQNLFIYTIDNYNNAGIYSAELITYDANDTPISTSNLSVTGNQFSANSAINSSTFYYAMIVLHQTSPCNATDTLYLQPCCQNDSLPQLIDITPDKIPNIVQNGNTYIYNPLIYPNQNSIIELHGQLLVNQTLEIYNTTINVDQGGIINVLPSIGFGLINSTIQAGCGHLWQGIHAQDQSEVKIRDGSTIRDAEYGLYYKGTISGDFANGTANAINFLDNYIAVYSPANPNGNNLNFKGSTGLGISINNTLNLLPDYPGQKTIPQSRSFAGFYLYDNPNFNNQITNNVMQINIHNMNIGIANIRGSITLPERVTIVNTIPISAYTNTRIYNGSAIYCEGTSNQEQTINFGHLLKPNNNLINNCKYGVNAFKNVNVYCYKNNINNVNSLGGVRVDNFNISSKTIKIFGNSFDSRFYCAIYCKRFIEATLEIDSNTFNTGTYFQIQKPYGNLENVAIRLAFVSPTTINGHIQNNTFNAARIGLYASNIRGLGNDTTSMFPIRFNSFNLNHTTTPSVSENPFHAGIYLENANKVFVNSNNIFRTNSLNDPTIDYINKWIGIKLDNCSGSNSIISENILNKMGSGLFIKDDCVGSNIYCNNFEGDPSTPLTGFLNGIYFSKAKLADQGKPLMPYNNFFTSFKINISKFGGTVDAVSWYLSGSSPIIPISVNPINNFIVHITNVAQNSFCGQSNSTLTDAIYERVRQIIYNELEYDENIEENHYLDKVFAYSVISNDSTLQALDQNYVDFINLHRQDNIGNYVDAIALSNEKTVIDALYRLNNMISNNTIEENNLIVDRIALSLIAEDRDPTENEIQDLEAIATTDELIGGPGVRNSRTLLDREYHINNFNLRISNTSTNNVTEILNLEQLLQLNDMQKEFVRLEVFDISGKLVYQNSLMSWGKDKLNYPNSLFLIKYYYENQYIGSKKELNTK
jgi:hypothetical protein